MSVKCNDYRKYIPLLMEEFSKDGTEDKSQFKAFLSNYFTSPSKVYSEFVSDVDYITPTPEYTITKYSSRTGLEEKTDSESQIEYLTDPKEYDRMKGILIKDLLNLSIYDLNTDKFVDWDSPDGDTNILNSNILNYKIKLLKQIANFIKEPINFKSNRTEDIELEFNNKLQKVESIFKNAEKSLEYYDAYNAYYILSNFDTIINNSIPFLTIKPEYKTSSPYSKYRYTYVGANAHLFTGFSTDEFDDASNSYSDLCKMLLKFFPEIDQNGDIIPYTSIGESSFKSIVYKLKSWANSSFDEEIQAELQKGVNANWEFIINKYQDAFNKKSIKDPEHLIYNQNKLRAIKKYLFGNNTNENLRHTFINTMNKTVLSSYVSYQEDDNEIVSKNLTERPIKMQEVFLRDVIDAASTYWSTNLSKLSELTKKYHISVIKKSNGYEIKIGNSSIFRDSEGKISVKGHIENFDQILNILGTLYIEPSFDEIARTVYKDNNKLKQQLYAPMLGTILINALNPSKQVVIDFAQLRDLARVLSIINGSDVLSVIKNSQGNNLPLYQMLCLSYRHQEIANKIKQDINQHPDQVSMYEDNIVYRNIQHIKSPLIRAEVNINGNKVNSADLTADDVLHLACGYDFFKNLFVEQSTVEGSKKIGIVGFQPHVYSDKNKHFIMQFDLDKVWDFGEDDSGKIQFNPKEILSKYFLTADIEDIEPLKYAFYLSNQKQLNIVVENILEDYNKVFNIDLESISDLKRFIEEKGIKTIKQAFRDKGVDFLEEIHASKVGKKYIFNETLEYLHSIFNDKSKFEEYLNEQFNKFQNEFSNAWRTLSSDVSLSRLMTNVNKEFVSDSGNLLEYIQKNGATIINPMIYSYFLMDNLLSNEYNKLMIGNVFSHKNGNKDNDKDHSLASRWIAQVKRMVIYGATYHSYAQGLKYGVPRKVKMACISDIGANVYNITGDRNSIDAMDGSGLTSPYLSRMENVSLIDASVGENKKTIYHDINSRFGNPTLLKWAEFGITNALRRRNGEVNADHIFKKMHSLLFNKVFEYSEQFDNLYYRDSKNGNYYKILSINVNGNIATRTRIQCTPNGDVGEDLITDTFVWNTIYNIDQSFGGSWAMEYDKDTETLQYTEKQNDYVNDIICDNDLKEYMIGWLVNKSATKVGASNVNNESAWTDDTDLMFTEMSTEFGGLQMNADHDLDDAEVTESSQMISALEQNGYTHDIATNVYNELGKFCADSVAEIKQFIDDNNNEGLYNIFGKAVIKAFATGEKDTLGLAQTFIKLAQDSLNSEGIQFKIPFSSSSINGIFNATVTTSLIKDAIKRYYDGVPAVLTPSYGMVQTHNIDGINYSYEELIDVINRRFKGTTFEGISLDTFMNQVYISDSTGNLLLNPYIIPVSSNDPIDFQDTIVIFDENQNYEIIKIDSYEKYDYYKNYDSRQKYKWTIKGKNLKGSDTVFYIRNGENNLKKYSIYESNYSRLLQYLNQTSSVDIKSLRDELSEQLRKEIPNDITEYIEDIINILKAELIPFIGKDFNEDINFSEYIPNLKKLLLNKQQQLLNDLADNKPFLFNNQLVQAESYQVIPTQIVMGKLYAKELGLQKGDTISKIKTQGSAFFRDKIAYNNVSTNADEDSYDWLLTDDSGRKLYVKLRDELVPNILQTSVKSTTYNSINDKIYYQGSELCSSNGKQFVSYTDTYGDKHDLVIIDDIDRVRELLNTKLFNNISRNYLTRNYKVLINEQYGDQLINIPVYKISNKTGEEYIQYVNIAEFNDTDSIIDALIIAENKKSDKRIQKIAEEKYKAFEKSLLFIGTRIPCQSMQSFTPMEIVLFDDTNTNLVFIPPMVSWLQGSKNKVIIGTL